MADYLPLEFENIGEYNRAVLQLLIDNNALLRVLLDYEIEKHAYRIAAEEQSEEIGEDELKAKKNEIFQQLNDKIREYL